MDTMVHVQEFILLGIFLTSILMVLVGMTCVLGDARAQVISEPVHDRLALGGADNPTLVSILTNEAGGLGRGWRGNTGRGFRAFARDEAHIQVHTLEIVDEAIYSGELSPQDVVAMEGDASYRPVSRWALLLGEWQGLLVRQQELADQMEGYFDALHRNLEEQAALVFLIAHKEVRVSYDAEPPTFIGSQ